MARYAVLARGRMNTIEAYRRAVREFDRRVSAIPDDKWDAPTPAGYWKVRDVVNHLVNEAKWTSPLVDGRTIEEVGDAFEGDLLGDDPKAAWREAKDEAMASAERPGVLERIVHVSAGDISGEEYLNQLLADHLVHSWDLARGIGVDDRMDPALVERVYAWAKPQEEDFKRSGQFGEKIAPPEDADLQTKLLAVFGRRL